MNPAKWLALTLLVFLSACSKLSLENYNKLHMGMHYDEVTKLIGTPDKCDDVLGLRNCRWGDEKRSINVSFAGDKVLVFSAQNLD